MDGLEASEKIIAMGTGIPIVAMTANVMAHERELYSLRGMNDYVGKPFTSQELWRCLARYLKPVDWQEEDVSKREQADMALRVKLVRNFVAKNKRKHTEIAEAVKAGDVELAHRLAHTLKANAGQLGKTLLQKAAADVEKQLLDVKDVSPQQMAALETELSVVILELSRQIDDSTPNGETAREPMDKESAMELLAALKPLLTDGDTECLKHIDGLRRIPGGEALTRLMEDFDFNLALSALAALTERINKCER
jgi:CheY-like chemotaxis protein